MSSHDASDWVRQGTPRGADWEDEQSEYGTALEPTEWDDHATEQSVPVETPRPRPRPATRAASTQVFTPANPLPSGSARTQPSPDSSADQDVDAADEPTVVSGLRMPEPASPVTSPRPEDEETMVRPLEVPAHQQTEPATPAAPQRPEPASQHPEPQRPTAQGPERARDVEDTIADQIVPPVQPAYQHPEQPAQAPASRLDPLPPRPVGGGEAVTRSVQTPRPRPEQVAPQHNDPDATQRFESAVPQRSAASSSSPGDPEQTSVQTGLFRGDAADGEQAGAETSAAPASQSETTAVMSSPVQHAASPTPAASPIPVAEQEEERRRQQKLEAERAARNERLGVVATSPENESRTITQKQRRTADEFLPSLGLFFLRLVTAGILAIVAYQGLTNIDGAAEALGRTYLPEPRTVAWIGGFLLAAMALLLVVGLLQRVVGFLLLALALCSLVFVRWGAFSPFVAGMDGFLGDRDLLLGAVGLLLITIGGGGWGIDAAFRRSREAAKAARTD